MLSTLAANYAPLIKPALDYLGQFFDWLSGGDKETKENLVDWTAGIAISFVVFGAIAAFFVHLSEKKRAKSSPKKQAAPPTFVVLRNNQQFGPFSADEINNYLDSGELADSDLAWHEGMPEWRPVALVMAESPQG